MSNSGESSNGLKTGRQFAETQPFQVEVVNNHLCCRQQIDIPLPSQSTNDHSLLEIIACSVSYFGSFVASWTHNAALQAAISDSDIDEVVERMKVEWTSVGHWLFALAAMNLSLFTIDAQSLFEVDDFAQKAIAISTVATGLGILCDAWFLIQLRHLGRWDFANRARSIYGSVLLFSLSAKFPSLTVLVSLGSLMVFGGRIACNTLPALVIVLGIVVLVVVIGVRFILSAATLLCSTIPGCTLAFSCCIRRIRRGDAENGGLPALAPV